MKKVIVISLLSAFVFSFSFRETKPFVILVDAAHGGKDLGFVLEDQEISEKDITLNFTRRLIKLSESDPEIKIISTRYNDEFLNLKQRLSLVKNYNPDLFISVHLDGFLSSAEEGLSLKVDPNSPQSEKSFTLAKSIINRLQAFGSSTVNPQVGEFDSYLLQKSDCPALLLNLGNMANTTDLGFINTDEKIDLLCKDLIKAIKVNQ